MEFVYFLLISILLGIYTLQTVISKHNDNDYHVVTHAPDLEDALYFELLEPEDISYTYRVRPAKDFGEILNRTLLNARLVPVDPIDGCSPLSNDIYVADGIAFIERGGCSFVTKTINAEQAGAHAVVIFDYDKDNDSHMIDMIKDETGRQTKIAAFFLLGKDGHMIKDSLENNRMVHAKINIPINVTGIPMVNLNQPPWTLW